MVVEMNKSSSIRLTPVQEIKLAKPATELYVGQILKTVVVTALTNNQVLININGQNLNAKTSHHFSPGELLEVKVIANQEETVLEVQQKSPISILQNALLRTLPMQAPPTQLLHTLSYLLNTANLSPALNQQIKNILGNIVSLSQLPQQMSQAINQSGVFLESSLFLWQQGMSTQRLKNDFKGQCFKLLNSLTTRGNNSPQLPIELESAFLEQNPLPLPGAIPQPLHQDGLLKLDSYTADDLLQLLRDQVSHVLARITSNQINHLSLNNNGEFLIMLDLPIKITDKIDVIPMMIKQHKAEPMHPAQWSVSFAINLANLGDIQATLSLNEKNIDIKINTQCTETMQLLNEYHNEIHDLISELGLKLRHWKLQIGLEANHIDAGNLRLLDIRI